MSSARARLGVLDGVSVIIGIVVGVSLFKAPALIFGAVPSAAEGMAVWVVGGVLVGVGALCYAELATTYPHSGGDVVYLTRAYGPGVGFLFGWAQLVAVLTGSIGAMAYVFADYAVGLFGGGSPAAYACAAVAALTGFNLFGVALGRQVQNALTLVKLAGLVAIAAAGWWASGGASQPIVASEGSPAYGFALILVLYAYGGWNDAAFVAADVRDPTRNMSRVLLIGTAAVVVIHLVINAAYLAGLGFAGVRASSAPAADVLGAAFGATGARAMALLVMISALGAIHGLVFTGSRIVASLGRDHPAFATLARWQPGAAAPVRALLVQGTMAVLLIAAVGTQAGRGVLDAGIGAVGFGALPWSRFGGGFDTLVAGTAPVFWAFFGLTGVSLFVLRRREPERPRPFEVPLYPLTPLVFCATCVGMLWASLDYAREIALVGLVPLAVGVPLYLATRRSGGSRPTGAVRSDPRT